MRTQLRAKRSQAGQAFVLVAIILLALMAGIGVAFDATYDYYNSVLAGRADVTRGEPARAARAVRTGAARAARGPAGQAQAALRGGAGRIAVE